MTEGWAGLYRRRDEGFCERSAVLWNQLKSYL